jgi:hypothetical protein
MNDCCSGRPNGHDRTTALSSRRFSKTEVTQHPEVTELLNVTRRKPMRSVPKSIFKNFVTPLFIHLADDYSTVDLTRRKGTLLAQSPAATTLITPRDFRQVFSQSMPKDIFRLATICPELVPFRYRKFWA